MILGVVASYPLCCAVREAEEFIEYYCRQILTWSFEIHGLKRMICFLRTVLEANILNLERKERNVYAVNIFKTNNDL